MLIAWRPDQVSIHLVLPRCTNQDLPFFSPGKEDISVSSYTKLKRLTIFVHNYFLNLSWSWLKSPDLTAGGSIMTIFKIKTFFFSAILAFLVIAEKFRPWIFPSSKKVKSLYVILSTKLVYAILSTKLRNQFFFFNRRHLLCFSISFNWKNNIH